MASALSSGSFGLARSDSFFLSLDLPLPPCRGGKFSFAFNMPDSYPHDPPKVKCESPRPVYHPNIDLEGNVCLNILREDWNPVLTISSVVFGLQFLFLDPNPDDPLNKDAAKVLTSDPKQFQANVRRSLSGCYIGNTYFPPCR